MSNTPLDETDIPASDEISCETYSTTEIWIIFAVIYAVSLIICIIYLVYRVDVKQFSFLIFVICLIYSSFFIMLNEMAMLDLFFSHEVGMVQFIDMISKFYKVFNYVDKVCGFFIFNVLISMMESGYSSYLKKFCDIGVEYSRKFQKIYVK